MIYTVSSDSFTKISESSGTLQSDKWNIEMSNEATPNSGIVFRKGEEHSFNGTDIYLRCNEEGKTTTVRVVPFTVDGGGGGSSGGAVGQGVMIDGETYHVIDSTDSDDLIDSYFPD